MYKKLTRYLGNMGINRFPSYVAPLKETLQKSGMNILFAVYVGKMLLISIIAAIVAFIATIIVFMFLGFSFLVVLPGGILLAAFMFFAIITLYHSYPYQLLSSKKTSIDSSMPFAVNHMAAIASSGVSPFVMFKLLSNVPEYGEVRNESIRIVRNSEIFGMDILTAIKNVAKRTPSDSFRQFLLGMTSTIETGGDLKKYLEGAAKDVMFDYRLKREKYTQTLSTYADIYTAVLIAAPLFLVTILSVMAMVFQGNILGMSIPVAMQMGAYVVIPLLNVLFILFINFTQPKL